MAARTSLSSDADTLSVGVSKRTAAASAQITKDVSLVFIGFFFVIGCAIHRDFCSQLHSIAEKPRDDSQCSDNECCRKTVSPQQNKCNQQKHPRGNCPEALSH